ncbi:MAG: C1 family peptidase [Nitrospira sp.]|nr:C1 family peptidase [Nitrospira sp.]
MNTPQHVVESVSIPPFTGVQDEPKLQLRQPLQSKLGKWMRNLFRFTFSAKPPSSFNWDDKAVVPPPGDQGQLAACISYAACLAAATSYRLKTGKAISTAPRVMHLCTMGLAPQLGTNSFKFENKAVADGLPYAVDGVMSSQAAVMINQAQCALFTGAGRLKVSAVRRFETADEVKSELSSTGPVIVHMKLFDDFWRSYAPGTIYKAPLGASSNVSHAVCLIGYDDDRQCWIGVNSRGVDWGANGRFLLHYEQCDVMAPGAAAYALSIQV